MSMTFATPNKTVSRFKANNSNIFAKLPSQLGSQRIDIGQAQAAPSITNAVGARPSVADNPQAINTPMPATDIYQTDETQGVKAIGRAGTKGVMAEQDLARRQAEADRQREADANLSAGNETFWNGLDSGEGSFDINGMPAGVDAEQMKYAQQIANIGKQKGFGEEDIRIAIMTALAESGLRNLNYGDADSVGLYQQRTSQGWGSIDQIMDPNYSIGKFYDTLKTSARGANPWNTAQAVQRSAFADGSNYQAQWGLANSIFSSLSQQGASKPTRGANGSLTWINSNNGKYHDFDGAWGAQCVDLYNFYMTGFVGGRSSVGEVNYAQELWQRHDGGALMQIAKNQRPQMGDIAIWSNAMNGQGGHVAIVAQDNGNGTIRVLNANATSAGPRGNTVMSNLSTGTLLGYLRPRKLAR